MGMFHVKARVANPATPQLSAEVSLLVDTGATLSWIPREVIEKLGVVPESKIAFLLADGRELIRPVGPVKMTVEGRTLTLPVAFSEPGEEAVLGVTSLEVLGFGVDTVAMKLVPRKLLALLRH